MSVGVQEIKLKDISTLDVREFIGRDEAAKEQNLLLHYQRQGVRIMDFLKAGGSQEVEEIESDLIEKLGFWKINMTDFQNTKWKNITLVFSYIRTKKPMPGPRGQMWAVRQGLQLVPQVYPFAIGHYHFHAHGLEQNLCNDSEFFLTTYVVEEGILQ